MFDANDEMIEKEAFSDESDGETPGHKEEDIDLIKQQKALDNYSSKITVNLGNEEYDKGKQQITNDIFEGRDKTQNA